MAFACMALDFALAVETFSAMTKFGYNRERSCGNIGYSRHIPHFACVGQTKVKLAKVTGSVFFRLPVRLVVFLAKSAFVVGLNLCDKAIVCLLRLETASEFHGGDLFWCKNARQYIYAYPMLE